MNNFENLNIKKITDYISSGIKKVPAKSIGVECEHIITDKNNQPVSFYGDNGVEVILEELSAFYPHKTYSDGFLVGLNDGKVYITLEPAAQIEVSIIPLESLEKIKNLYLEFVNRIADILEKYGYILHNIGYHPTSKADDLQLIPKERYRLMDSYFRSKGNKPRYMMRGSASVQVNIDYFSEDDFAQKFRLANLLSPLFYLITDNSDVFEGEKFEGYSARSFAWENVDNSRCGFLDFSTFEEYARWIHLTQPVFIQENGKDVFCPDMNNAVIFKNKELTADDISHIMSMVFPNVRVKRFIEIRAADSMPCKFMLAYAALIKGLFYSPETVKELNNMFSFVSVEGMHSQIELIRDLGFNCNYFGFEMKDIIDKVFNLAQTGLDADEKSILTPLMQSALNLTTPKQLLKPEVTIL